MNEKKRGKVKQIVGGALAFLIPVLVMLGICKVRGMYPLGEKSWLIYDMDNQYVSYFSYFRAAIKEHGFLYTFSKTLGGDMLGFSAYYLMSPFNFLFLLVSTREIPYMIAWISMIKLGLCGLSFYTLANYEQKKYSNLIFSSAYALMSYTLFYLSNIMWFDAVYMLPIVIMCIKKLIDKKSPFLYIVSLAYVLISNYYIGYMICIFCVLYYFYYLLCVNGEKLGHKWKPSLIFAFSSLLAGGMSMWLLLPTKYSLDGVKSPFSWKNITMESNFYWDDILVKLLPGSTEGLMSGMPNLYCGMLVLFFVGIFFLNKKITLKRKAGTLLLCIIFFFSFYVKGFNLMWHGFNTPIGFPYRYSFLFCFLLICTAKEGFDLSSEMNLKNRLVASILTLLAICAITVLMYRKHFAFMTPNAYAYGIMFVLFSVLVCFLYQKKTIPVATAMGLILILTELGINGSDIYKNLEGMPITYYGLYTDQAESQVNLISGLDLGFYRMEKDFYRTMNDAMQLDYAGLGHYSSTEKPQIKRFMQAAGFRNNGNWAFYNRGSTFSIESFLGVKYLLSLKELGEPYVCADKIDGTYIYNNPYAFSIAWLTDGNLEDISVDNSGDKFAFQNELLGNVCCVGQIFTRQPDYSTLTQNVVLIDDRGTYQKVDSGAEAYIEYSFTVTSEQPLYMYLNTDTMKVARVYLNGIDAGKYFDIKQYDILSISDYVNLHPGDQLTIRIELCENTISITDVQIYYEDVDMLAMCYEYQKEGAIDLERITDSHLRATFGNAYDRNKILFSIPYDKGWKVYLDGKRVDTSVGAGIFLTISDVPGGEHAIELRYIPYGFVQGLVLSIVCLVLFIVWYIYFCKKNKDRLSIKNAVMGFLAIAGICLVYLLCLFASNKVHETDVKNMSESCGESMGNQKTVFMGKMDQDNNPENGAEPIEWIVLDMQDGKALLVSKYALAYLPYAVDSLTATWDTSYVREWLNRDFYENTFTEEEKKQILLSGLDNAMDATKYIDAGSNTEDYVFLLDRNDITKYCRINAEVGENRFYSESAICEPTASAAALCKREYTITQNMYDTVYRNYGYSANVVGVYGCDWWIRNPGLFTPINALTVGANGNVYDLGTSVSNYAFVRPAMWVSVDFVQ